MAFLEGLDKFGLRDLEGVELFAKKKENQEEAAKAKIFRVEDCVYEKQFTCPVCSLTFGNPVMRAGKLQPVSIDYDLRPIFREPIQPMFYDVVICPGCGFAAIRRSFGPMTERQRDLILTTITPRFRAVKYPLQLTLEMAAERYKLALLCAIVREARDGEKAYLCMKLAWLCRSARDEAGEADYLQRAYEGFSAAYAQESFPICGLDEHTVIYLLAAFAKALGRYDESLRLASQLIVNRAVPYRLKERVRDLKNAITAERNQKS